MAIYHLTAKTGSRNGGQSAKAKADYIQREGRYSRDRAEVLHTQSGHLPEWAERPADYWDAADLYERANGRLFKEVEFALPVELTLDQQRELVDEFARHLTEGERLPYTLAIHAGKGENPHCHLMISERKNDGIKRPADQWFKRHNAKQPERGGAQKSESLKPKGWLEQTREAWADHANRALERAGHDARIDHRTLEAQGIERLPGRGVIARKLAREYDADPASADSRHYGRLAGFTNRKDKHTTRTGYPIHAPVKTSPGLVQTPGGRTRPGKTTVLAPSRTWSPMTAPSLFLPVNSSFPPATILCSPPSWRKLEHTVPAPKLTSLPIMESPA